MPHAVTPKRDCPHVREALKAFSGTPDELVTPCLSCTDDGENWTCAFCHACFCSRYVNSHCLEHCTQQVGHDVAVSHSDMSAWCYKCDSYIADEKLDEFIGLVYRGKFGEADPSLAASSASAAAVGHEDTASGSRSAQQQTASSSHVQGAPAGAPGGDDASAAAAAAEAVSHADVASVQDDADKVARRPSVASSTSSSSSSSASIDVDLADALREASEATGEARKLKTLDMQGIADYILSGNVANVIVAAGAGVSTAAGIPDFRTPGTGLYDNLEKYNLPDPMAIFSLDYFRTRPEPFFTLAKELYPGGFHPTLSHHFIRLLQDKGLLLRAYTQNIDTLERLAGIRDDLLIEAHGSFGRAFCIECKAAYTMEEVRERVFADEIPRCTRKAGCSGLVKPNIVFFGENLPESFFRGRVDDFPKCDLLIVMGTSLQVEPFGSIVELPGASVPRLLINREPVRVSRTHKLRQQLLEQDYDEASIAHIMAQYGASGFAFDDPSNSRDVFSQGTCDDGVRELARLLGWEDELVALERAYLAAHE